MFETRKIIILLWLICNGLTINQVVLANNFNIEIAPIVLAEKFYRTEVYFGMDKPNGGEVSEKEWDNFLETEVTPLFPKGLTVITGYGQFLDSKNNIERENSRMLILFYTKKERRLVHEKIEKIRAVYKKLFEQESVLRVDFRQPIEISF